MRKQKFKIDQIIDDNTRIVGIVSGQWYLSQQAEKIKTGTLEIWGKTFPNWENGYVLYLAFLKHIPQVTFEEFCGIHPYINDFTEEGKHKEYLRQVPFYNFMAVPEQQIVNQLKNVK